MNGRALAAAAAALTLAGCASGPKYACGVPEGVTCQPVSAVYASSAGGSPALAGAASGEEAPTVGGAEAVASRPRAEVARPVVATVQPGEPVLTAPRVLRLWIAPWEDAAGDLHDETFLYLRIDDGRWTLTR